MKRRGAMAAAVFCLAVVLPTGRAAYCTWNPVGAAINAAAACW